MSTVTHLMSSKLNDFSSPPSDSRCDLRRLLSAKPSCFLLLPFAPSPRLLIIHAMGQPLHSQPIRLSFFKELHIFRRWLVEILNKRLALEIFRNKLLSLNWRRKAPSPFAKELLQADLARRILVTVLTALQYGSTRCLHYILSQCYH